jgi:hypothetical protein
MNLSPPVHAGGRSTQRSCSGRTSRIFFEVKARSIARSASATASDLVAAWPVRGFASIETAHFHSCRPIPWTMVYSTPRYSMMCNNRNGSLCSERLNVLALLLGVRP